MRLGGSPKRTKLARERLQAIAANVISVHDEAQPIHSAARVLAAYDGMLAESGVGALATFDLMPKQWIELLERAEIAGQRSEISGAARRDGAPSARPPTL